MHRERVLHHAPPPDAGSAGTPDGVFFQRTSPLKAADRDAPERSLHHAPPSDAGSAGTPEGVLFQRTSSLRTADRDAPERVLHHAPSPDAGSASTPEGVLFQRTSPLKAADRDAPKNVLPCLRHPRERLPRRKQAVPPGIVGGGAGLPASERLAQNVVLRRNEK